MIDLHLLLLIALIGGALHLDRTYAFQFLVSRPLIVSSIVGVALGSPLIGLAVGVSLEFLWLGIQPLGTVIPPNDTLVATIAPAGIILAANNMSINGMPQVLSLSALALLLSLPFSEIGKLVDIWLRKKNTRIMRKACEKAEEGNTRAVERLHLVPMLNYLISFIVLTGLGVFFVARASIFAFPLLSDTVLAGLSVIFWSLPFFGISAVLSSFRNFMGFGFSFLASYILFLLIIRGAL